MVLQVSWQGNSATSNWKKIRAVQTAWGKIFTAAARRRPPRRLGRPVAPDGAARSRAIVGMKPPPTNGLPPPPTDADPPPPRPLRAPCKPRVRFTLRGGTRTGGGPWVPSTPPVRSRSWYPCISDHLSPPELRPRPPKSSLVGFWLLEAGMP
jgi:hypothetical protein